MKSFIALLIFAPLVIAFTKRSSEHTDDRYAQIAAQLETQITAYGIVKGVNRFYDVQIDGNGNISFYITGRNKPVNFNLYRLYKNYKSPLGFFADEASVAFRLTESNTISVSLGTPEKAKEIYGSFEALVMSGKDRYAPGLPLDINETVDSINLMLKRLTWYDPQIRVSVNGVMVITDANKQFFHFNIADLANAGSDEGFEVNGIEMIPCTIRNVAPNNRIKFNTGKGTVAYIVFYHISDAELNTLHQLFIHLRYSMINIMYS